MIQLPLLQAQTLFLENFETSPVTSILNAGETQLINGPSPCGKATRGDTTDFNSANVNFQGMQNATHFLGVNPQTPCGGYYHADLNTGSLNLSGQDSLSFKFRFIVTNTLFWGSGDLRFDFSDGTTTHSINIGSDIGSWNFNTWTSKQIGLPSFLIAPAVTLTLHQMGGGDGVGLDDIQIVNIAPTSVSQQSKRNLSVQLYPNPFTSSTTLQTDNLFKNASLTVYNSFGRTIKQVDNLSGQTVTLFRDNLPSGLYFIRLTQDNKIIAADKLVITD